MNFSNLNAVSYTPIPFYIGLNSGVNLSKVNYSEHLTSFNTSYQIGLEIESFIRPIRNWENSILYGITFELKKYEIRDENTKFRIIESNYLTIPLKYNRNFFEFLNDDIIFNVQAGVFYSLLLNSTNNNSQLALPNHNYGVILGTGFTYITSTGLYLILEYNFQNGFAPIDNTTPFSSNISHVINIGFKVPSTAIF